MNDVAMMIVLGHLS